MIAAIFSKLGLDIVDKLLGRIMQPFEMYFKKQISMEELRAKMLSELMETVAEVEKSHADTLAKTYASFVGAMEKSRLLQVMWAAALGSQIFVLFWNQWVIPMAFMLGYGGQGWKPGTSAEWAYLLIGGLLGLGPIVLRGGPGKGDLIERLRDTIGKK